MSSLLQSFSGLLTPDNLGAIAKLAGNLSPDQLKKGAEIVGPLLQKGLSGAASSPEGLKSLTGLLDKMPADTTSQVLGGLTNFVQGGGDVAGVTSQLQNLSMGAGGNATTAFLSNKLGFNIKPLIAAGAPLLLGQLKKLTSEQGLDANGIAKMLKDGDKEFTKSGSPNVALIDDAVKFGGKAAEVRAKFTDAEWATIKKAPLAAAAAVIMASPNRFTGGAAELKAFGEAMGEQGRSAASGLVNLAFGDDVDLDDLASMAKNVTKADVMNVLKSSVKSVEAKDPEHAKAFKAVLAAVALKVAMAAKEGGFLGFGGKDISDAEQAVLDEIKAATGA